jgi:Ca2+-binding EF-hand superfamily protein
MRIALLSGCWLFTIALALAAPAGADEPGAATDQMMSPPHAPQTPADRDIDRSTGPRVADVGDSNRVHFRSPINVLSHLQVNIQITIGAPAPQNPWPPEAKGRDSQGPAAQPSADEARPAADNARSARRDRQRGQARTPRRTRSPQARRRFRQLDTDGNGRLSRDELQSALPARRAARRMRTLDADGDGYLTVQELIALPQFPRSGSLSSAGGAVLRQ